MKAPAEQDLLFLLSHAIKYGRGTRLMAAFSCSCVPGSAESVGSTGGLANGTDSLIVCVFNESLSYRSAVSSGSCSNREAAQPGGGAATPPL